MVGLPAAHAQDSAAPAGYPAAGPAGHPTGTDPNASPPASAPNDPDPPPGAYPAPPPAVAPPTAAQPAPTLRNLLVALPFIGIQSIQSCEGDCVLETGPGLRIGAFVGLRVSDYVSLNGELVYDVLNGPRAATDGRVVNNTPSGLSHIHQVDAAPFFHAPLSSNAELLLGPKVGYFHIEGWAISGTVLGANVGGFFRISNMVALGALLNFDWERQLSLDQSPTQEKMISATVGALF